MYHFGKAPEKPKLLEVDKDGRTKISVASPPTLQARFRAPTVGNALRRVLLFLDRGRGHHRHPRGGRAPRLLAHPGRDGGHADLILNLKRVPLEIRIEHPERSCSRPPSRARCGPSTSPPIPTFEILDPEAYIATLGQLHPVRGDAGASRATAAGPRQLRRGPLDRLDAGGLRPLAVKKVNYLMRTLAHQPGHRLREADPRGLDQRRRLRVTPSAWPASSSRPPRPSSSTSRGRGRFWRDAGRAQRGRPRGLVGGREYVDEMELFVRSYNCLKNTNIKTMRKLVQKRGQAMLKTKNFGGSRSTRSRRSSPASSASPWA